MRVRFVILMVVWLLIACAWPGAGPAAAQPAASPVRINEFLADNDAVIHDEFGEYDDVVELYNPGPGAAALGGMYLSDDAANPTKFRIADAIAIPAGGFLLFWADSTPTQGIYHTNFGLSKGGESIGLFDTDANGHAAIDTYKFGAQVTDVSEGRCPNGGQKWLFFTAPTPGATNEPCGSPPVISATKQMPAYPGAGETVTVSATITDEGSVVAAKLWYSTGGAFVAVPMAAAGSSLYQAVIPAQPAGTWVQYYLEAENDVGRKAVDPVGAPQRTYSYVAGYAPPPVTLNEVMSDNQTTLVDPEEPAEHPDWLELYNDGAAPVDLGGLYLTDDPTNPVQFPIPAGVMVPAKGFLVLYADGEPEQGPRHTNFKLSAGGEPLGLYGAEGKVRIDRIQIPALQPDVSYARHPDGAGPWSVQSCVTPGGRNALCRSFLPLVADQPPPAVPPPLPLRLDCGSDAAFAASTGAVFLPDHAWNRTAPYGYAGGSQRTATEWWDWWIIGGTNDPDLYRTQRYGWQEYRVGLIPNGDYLLILHFEEREVHGPGLNVFDIAVEGQTVLDNFDIYDQAGRYHVLNRRFAVRVADGELNVKAAPVAGEARLAAFELIPRGRDAAPPGIPAGLAATASYRAVGLTWNENPEDDLAGYNVYRAEQEGGPYQLLTAARVYLPRYQDNVSRTHVPYYYRITAVDIFGNESKKTDFVSAAALTPRTRPCQCTSCRLPRRTSPPSTQIPSATNGCPAASRLAAAPSPSRCATGAARAGPCPRNRGRSSSPASLPSPTRTASTWTPSGWTIR